MGCCIWFIVKVSVNNQYNGLEVYKVILKVYLLLVMSIYFNQYIVRELILDVVFLKVILECFFGSFCYIYSIYFFIIKGGKNICRKIILEILKKGKL